MKQQVTRNAIDCTAAAVVCAAACLTTCYGDGFRNPTDGAAAQGRASVRLTQGDDPSVAIHNPANLMDLKQPSVMPSLSFAYLKAKYTSPLGQRENTKDPWAILPSVCATYPLKRRPCVAAIAVNSPYGQSTRWSRTGGVKDFAPYFAEMKTVNVNPSLATRLSRNVYLGAGISLMWSDLEFRQLMAPAGQLTFEGDGCGLGGNVGVTWLLSDRQRVAAVYRSPVDVEYDGSLDIENPAMPDSDFDTEISFPSVAAIGYGIQVTDSLRVEANVEWMEHSRNDSMDLDVGLNNALLLGALGTTSLDQDWDDTWTVALGTDWTFSRNWVFRTGWTCLPTPIPDETLMPSLPQGDKHMMTVGLGFQQDAHTLDLAYTYGISDDRDIANAPNPITGQPYPGNGKYELDIHLLGISYAYVF